MSRRRSSEAENPFWITYSDLLSSLVMVVFVLLFVFQSLSMIQTQRLNEKNEELQEQKKNIEEQKEKLQLATKKINDDAGTFRSLLGDLKDLKEEYNRTTKGRKLQIDDDGNLIIPDEILFSAGQFQLQPRGQDFLRKFIPDYAKVVTKSTYASIIDGVVFEGHADTRGSKGDNANYFENMELTSKRAQAVNKFALTKVKFSDPSHRTVLRRYISTAGRSNIEARLNLTPQELTQLHSIDKPEFRKVTVRLILKNPITKWKQVE